MFQDWINFYSSKVLVQRWKALRLKSGLLIVNINFHHFRNKIVYFFMLLLMFFADFQIVFWLYDF